MKRIVALLCGVAVLAAVSGITLGGFGAPKPGAPKALPTTEGTVVKVDGDKLVLNVKDSPALGQPKEKETTITTTDKTKVTLDDKDVKLADLKAGQTAVVTYALPDPPAPGASLVVAKVEAKSAK